MNTKTKVADLSELNALKEHPVSEQLDDVFKGVIKNDNEHSDLPSDEEFSLISDDLTSSEGNDMSESKPLDEGFELSFGDDQSPELGTAEVEENSPDENYGDLSLEDAGADLNLDEEETTVRAGESSFKELSFEDPAEELIVNDEGEDINLGFTASNISIENVTDEAISSTEESDLSDDAREKLKEIDAIMDFDASQAKIDIPNLDENLDEPLVSDDLDLGSLNFGSEESAMEEVVEVAPKEEKVKKKKRESSLSQDLKEISGAYSGEMERTQATISNLRADREELLLKIQKLEEDKILQSRQSLSMRAELDEKKIELTIVRKKLNEEISDLKDRLKLHDEKRLILEEKNRILAQELDKASQKNKIDVKKIQIHERELEQRLELLKSDAETQIRHRDLKILELKRRIDSMEFDMESISLQEKRSVESRFELEDKLEKAIKTLRSAITVLEDETDKASVIEALKKNIDV